MAYGDVRRLNFDSREAEIDYYYNAIKNHRAHKKWVDAEIIMLQARETELDAKLFFMYIDSYIPQLVLAQLDIDLDAEFDGCYPK